MLKAGELGKNREARGPVIRGRRGRCTGEYSEGRVDRICCYTAWV